MKIHFILTLITSLGILWYVIKDESIKPVKQDTFQTIASKPSSKPKPFVESSGHNLQIYVFEHQYFLLMNSYSVSNDQVHWDMKKKKLIRLGADELNGRQKLQNNFLSKSDGFIVHKMKESDTKFFSSFFEMWRNCNTFAQVAGTHNGDMVLIKSNLLFLISPNGEIKTRPFSMDYQQVVKKGIYTFSNNKKLAMMGNSVRGTKILMYEPQNKSLLDILRILEHWGRESKKQGWTRAYKFNN